MDKVQPGTTPANENSETLYWTRKARHLAIEIAKLNGRIERTEALISSAMFHFWDCDGGCGMLHSSMAKLAAAVDYGVSPKHKAEIAAYDGKRVPMTMEIHDAG